MNSESLLDAMSGLFDGEAATTPQLVDAGDAGAWFTSELQSLIEVLGLAFSLRVAIGLVLSIAVYRGVAYFPRLLWRVGLDRERRGASIAAVASLLALVLGLLSTLRPLFVAAPAISLLSVALLLVLSSFALPNLVQSILAGVRLSGRGRLIEGQQVEIDEVRGTVRRIGLLETTLRTGDGATVHVPNHLLAKSKLKVLRAQHAALVDVDVRVEGELSDEQLERLRAAVYLSPYRRAGTRPSIDEGDRDRGRVQIHLQTWATRDADLVKRALRRVVLQSLEEGDDER